MPSAQLHPWVPADGKRRKDGGPQGVASADADTGPDEEDPKQCGLRPHYERSVVDDSRSAQKQVDRGEHDSEEGTLWHTPIFGMDAVGSLQFRGDVDFGHDVVPITPQTAVFAVHLGTDERRPSPDRGTCGGGAALANGRAACVLGWIPA